MFTSFRFGVLEFGGWEGEWGDLGYKTELIWQLLFTLTCFLTWSEW
jgi:hypothetical protein